ncbi:SIMPL domain-containing protein [Candidatus Nomurabacteria bacterium]|nr:SIMPL domain-containing protein [Candidatus Nomurabacteria bacterium]
MISQNHMENTKNKSFLIISAVLLVFSVIFFLSARAFSDQGKYVEVKGLSEKIVKADVAIWSVSFDDKSNDIDSLYKSIEKDTLAIQTFLKTKGFDDSEINIAPVNIYQDTYKDAVFRYNANTQLSVYTKKVDLVKSSSKETLSLVKQGVTLNQNSINFEFSDINSVKPEMLAEAIKNAKDSAAQFAKESGSGLGSVARGNQGVFDITDKDPGSPEYKKIRVVSTLRFLLK